MAFEHFISVGRARLRCGYTTGTCAAAAARGAAEFLLHGIVLQSIQLDTPAGILVTVDLLEHQCGPGWASCAVRKDGGDDPDATHGILIFARVTHSDILGIQIDGGEGVGRVTLPGLDQPVGAAAINSVPRRMITTQLTQAIESTTYHGLRVVISIPQGTQLNTFNPRLGIVGGISILGTSGIVRPMSEAALVDSIRVELDMKKAAGCRDIVITPGNYGETFCATLGLHASRPVICANYIGETLDYAAGLGMKSLLLVGHLGKLVKIAAGNMNTHSSVSDARRETLGVHTALLGGDRATVQAVFDAPTTDAAIEQLEQAGLRHSVMVAIAEAIGVQLSRRGGDSLQVEALFFSNRFGILGQTAGVESLLQLHCTPTQTERTN